VHLRVERNAVRRESRRLLALAGTPHAPYGSRDGDREERDLRVVPFQLPAEGLLELVPGDPHPSVLSEPRGDHDGGPVHEEPVPPPALGGLVHKVVQPVDEQRVQGLEVLKVQPDGVVAPASEGGGEARETRETWGPLQKFLIV
jgi:hypothetical protein